MTVTWTATDMDDPAVEARERGSGWVAPERRAAIPLATTPLATATTSATTMAAGPGPSSGIAVARGDARRPTTGGPSVGGSDGDARPSDGTSTVTSSSRSTGEDPAALLPGNPLRGLSVVGPGAVLDQAFDLLRFRFRRWVALAAALFIPVQMIDLMIALSYGSGSTAITSEGLSQFRLLEGAAGTSGWAWVVVGLQSLMLFILGMAAGHLVAGWLDGRDDPFGSVVGAVCRRMWVAPLVVVPTIVAKLAAACFGGVGFFLVDALFLVAGPVAGAELLGPGSTMARSFQLARQSYGTALVVSFGGFCITTVLRVALGAGPLALVSMLGLPSEWLVAIDQAASVTLLVTMPLTACIAARAHVDLRCRADGFDLVRREEARGLR